MKNKKSILFLAPYPEGFGPSQRFRLEIYFSILKKNGWLYDYHTFYSEKSYSQIYKPGAFIKKFMIVFKAFFMRFAMLTQIRKYEYIFVQREVTPVGPPLFEWLIVKVFRKKLIYDFDDAIWLPNFSHENRMFQKFKSYWKIKYIIRWSHKTIAGNQFLEEFAKNFTDKTIILPTIVDTENQHNKNLYQKQKKDKPIIGWTGTLTTNLHIESLLPVFTKLNETFDYQLLLVSNKKPDINLPNVTFEQWQKNAEIHQLIQFDIGLMPLRSNYSFYQGKCGFKAIQYMSLGIPTVVSPVGVNKLIVDDKINGFHADSHEDWVQILSDLLMKQTSDTRLSESAINKIKSDYSLLSKGEIFMAIFK